MGPGGTAISVNKTPLKVALKLSFLCHRTKTPKDGRTHLFINRDMEVCVKWSSLPKSLSCKKNPVSFKLSYILSNLTVNIQVGKIYKFTKHLLCKHEKDA